MPTKKIDTAQKLSKSEGFAPIAERRIITCIKLEQGTQQSLLEFSPSIPSFLLY
jgi:hypothetical protein